MSTSAASSSNSSSLGASADTTGIEGPACAFEESPFAVAFSPAAEEADVDGAIGARELVAVGSLPPLPFGAEGPEGGGGG